MFGKQTDMDFNDVFNFLIKRLKEIGYTDIELLERFVREFRVKSKIHYLDSGLIINPDYKKYGFKEK